MIGNDHEKDNFSLLETVKDTVSYELKSYTFRPSMVLAERLGLRKADPCAPSVGLSYSLFIG